MITDRALAALRIAATVNHLYPMLVTELRAGDRTVLRVGAPGPGAGPTGEGGLQLTPCGFRAATARGWTQHRAGHRLRLLELDADPALEVESGPGDEVWPSGIARVRTGDLVVYVFGTFLVPDRCRRLARDLLDGMPAPEGLLDLVLQRDTDTDVTVVSAEVDPERADLIETAVLDLLESMLARYAAAELLDDLTPERTRP